MRELGPDERVDDGNAWTVSVAPVHHFAPHLISYGYRIDCDGRSIVYSGDTGPCRALTRLAADCDVLVHMCHYLSGSAPSDIFAAFTAGHLEAARAAEEAKARTLVISHVTQQFDRPGVRERVIAEMSRVYGETSCSGPTAWRCRSMGPRRRPWTDGADHEDRRVRESRHSAAGRCATFPKAA